MSLCRYNIIHSTCQGYCTSYILLDKVVLLLTKFYWSKWLCCYIYSSCQSCSVALKILFV